MNTVSVIVPAHRVDYGLRQVLEALKVQEGMATFELVVANDGDDPAVRAECEARGVSVVPSLPGGSSYRARNAALGHVHGEVLAFVDSNKVPGKDWLRKGLEEMDRLGADYLAGPVEIIPRDPGTEDPAYWLQRLTAFPCERYLSQDHYGVTGNLFVRRRVVDQVGPFLAHLVSGGDKEWGRRIFQAGFTQAYSALPSVSLAARTQEQLIQKQIRVVAGRIAYLKELGTPIRSQMGLLDILRHWLGEDGFGHLWDSQQVVPATERAGVFRIHRTIRRRAAWFELGCWIKNSVETKGLYQ